MAVLEARGLTCAYGGVRALDRLDLVVEAGLVHGLIGPNGAGKSTCMEALSGGVRPSEGVVLLDGEDVTRRSVRWRRHAGLSRSFQRTSIFPALTVHDQLDLAARRAGETDLDTIVALLSLEAFLDERCADIAYGDQRRVDIALALLGRPRVLLLDEPTAGLSVEESLVLGDHVAALAKEREVTVLLVEHDLDVVFRVCDVLTVLHLGRLLAHGDPLAVRADPRVVEAYLGSAA